MLGGEGKTLMTWETLRQSAVDMLARVYARRAFTFPTHSCAILALVFLQGCCTCNSGVCPAGLWVHVTDHSGDDLPYGEYTLRWQTTENNGEAFGEPWNNPEEVSFQIERGDFDDRPDEIELSVLFGGTVVGQGTFTLEWEIEICDHCSRDSCNPKSEIASVSMTIDTQ